MSQHSAEEPAAPEGGIPALLPLSCSLKRAGFGAAQDAKWKFLCQRLPPPLPWPFHLQVQGNARSHFTLSEEGAPENGFYSPVESL